MGFQFNALKLEDEIIISGWYANNGMADSLIMTLGLFNESFDFLKYIRIGSNYLQNNRAILHSLSAFNNKVYLCGVNNFSWFKFYGNSSSIRLLKLDNNLNEIWDKSYYENDEYYYLPIVTLATKDGGNLMVSTKYHNDQTDEILSVHLLKVDSLGNYIPNTVEDIAATKQGIRVYPNPGTTELNFSMPDNYNSVAVNLYTLSGTKIRSKPLVNNNSSMNTENLPNGIYIWEVQTSNGYKERGKWIKQ